MMDEKFLGKLIAYNVDRNTITLKCDFISPSKLKIMEELFVEAKDGKYVSFYFRSTQRIPKTYPQLKKYYQLIKDILKKLNIEPEADTIKTFDEEIKKNALRCESIVIYDKEIPIIPSKANMSIEELSKLIEYIYNVYGELLEEEE